MCILQQKLKLPDGVVKITKGEKILFLNPEVPDWIVVSKNGAAILKLCNGKRTVEDIAESLSSFWRKDSKHEIISFFDNIVSETTFFSPSKALRYQYKLRKLRIVQLSLVRECNLKCVYCYADDREVLKDKLSREDYFNLIDEINSIVDCAEIVFTGGEPLLSPYVLELAEYATKLGHKAHLLTNGIFVTEKNTELIANLFDLIKISVDGSNAKIHEFHRGKETFAKTMKAIDLLLKHDAPLQIAMTVTQKNIHDISTMAQKFGSRLTFAPLFSAGRASNNTSLSITGREYYEALASVEGIKPLSSLHTSLASSKQHPIMKCAMGDAEISIDEAGNVYPCQLLHFPQFCAGNIKKQSLKSIYETSQVLQDCKKLNVLEVEGCKDCEIRFICGGACRARTFFEEGRMDVSGSFCEYEKLAFINGIFELYEF